MEKLMHYVWQHKLCLQSDMVTVDGRRVAVVDPGLHNNDAGPDFFNAKIKIGDDMWCGNVEIHVKASDWYRHGHQNDMAYDSVVLHVVGVNDMSVRRADGHEIAQMVMSCAPDFSQRYDRMVNGADEPVCRSELVGFSKLYVTDWLSSLAYERLYQKVDRICALHKRLGGNWTEVLYVTLARALGFGINSAAFERLALATPLHCLMKHRDSCVTVEGTLFGQAGFLDNPPDRSHYVERMIGEYEFMQVKFGLTRPVSPGWRMARMRPTNFPHRRIATLAALIERGFGIAADIFNVKTEDEARRLFDIELAGYWSRRYNFMADSAPSVRALSHDSVSLLIINVVAPMLYAYGQIVDDSGRCDAAVGLLQSLKAENNSAVRAFTSAGIECNDAFTSQALVQLRRNYCEQRKCLYCRIGHRILAEKALVRSAGQASAGSESISS